MIYIGSEVKRPGMEVWKNGSMEDSVALTTRRVRVNLTSLFFYMVSRFIFLHFGKGPFLNVTSI